MVPAATLGAARIWINQIAKTGDPAFAPDHKLSVLYGLPTLRAL